MSSAEPAPAMHADIEALRAALATAEAARREAEARASGAEAMVAHLKLLIGIHPGKAAGIRVGEGFRC